MNILNINILRISISNVLKTFFNIIVCIGCSSRIEELFPDFPISPKNQR